MTLTSSQNARWPLSAALICVALGAIAGACGARWIPHPDDHAHLLDSLSETALLVCLFLWGYACKHRLSGGCGARRFTSHPSPWP